MNCLALEQGHEGATERIVIDCGVTFPNEDYGVELEHPRFDALLEAPDALLALVLTHGHEDHIGGVPYLVRALMEKRARPLEVLGPRYALELARGRLDELGIAEACYRLRPIEPGQRVELGGFSIEPVRVTHSMVDATALIIDTDSGTVVHSGDFKLEEAPLDRQPTDEARLRRAGDDGVRLLLSDSTNVFQGGQSGAERDVALALERLIEAAEGRVVVGLFASNVHRLGALAEIARHTGRHVCLLGRSVNRHAEVARSLGWLDWPSDLVVSPAVAASLPRRRVLYLATGTQGEPRGALARLAADRHPELRLGRGDLVVLSSRVIPGVEPRLFAMQDALLRLGVELVTRLTHPEIHASGHAHRDEQRRFIELLRPSAFIPVHGTPLHLKRHGELATEAGVTDVMVIGNGDRVALGPDGLRSLDGVVSGRVGLAAGRPVPADVVAGRRELGRAGLVAVFVDLRGAERAPSVRVITHGVGDEALVRRATEGAALGVVSTGATRDVRRLSEAIRRAVRARLRDATGQRPVVEVDVLGRERAAQ